MPEPTSPAAPVGTLSPPPGQNGRINPYVGPRALGPGEPIYGRERELLDLRDLLIAERIVLLYSPSGAGKTSLIQAGLIPEMEREEFAVLPLMRVGKNPAATAGNRYLASAILSLEEKLAPGEASLPVADVARTSFADYLERREELLPSGNSKLLIFDQFEEILTVDPLDQEGKAEFFAQVGAVLRNTSRWALFSIREDYVAALDPYTRAVPTRLKSNLRLDLLGPEAARLAIEEPARNQGVSFTADATSQLIDDLRRVLVQSRAGTFEPRLGPYVEPVHLQVVCSQLWEKPRSNPSRIGVDELATIGDVDSALGEYYATHVGKVAGETGVKEKAIREWFDRSLITESGIRSEVMWQPGGSEGLNDAAIDALEAAHLVRKEERRDATWLELSHNRLVTPIRTNNARWFEGNLSLLQQQAALWFRQSRNEALCLRGAALIEARKWAAEHAGELSEIENEFLIASREKEKVRSARRLYRWLFVLGVFATITLGLAIYAFNQAKIASARELAAAAQGLLDKRLDLATLLAVEASRKADLPDIRGNLLMAALANPRLKTFLHGHQTPVETVAFNFDGSELASGDWKNRVVFFNLKFKKIDRILHPVFADSDDLENVVVRSIAFSSDGKYMAAGSKKGAIVLIDLKTQATIVLQTETGDNDNIWSVIFSQDTQFLASGGQDGKIIVWDVGGRRSLFTADPKDGPVRSVAFSTSGSYLAAGCADGNVLIWKSEGGTWNPNPIDKFPASVATEEERKKRGATAQITCVAFSPKDDNLLASGSRDWTITLRDVAGKRNVACGEHSERISRLAFSKEGILVTAGWDNTLRLWNIPGAPEYRNLPEWGRPLANLNGIPALMPIGPPFTGHVGSVFAVAFSPVGATVASGGRDRKVILWDTNTYVPTEGPGLSTADFALALSPDGRYEVTGYKDGTIRVNGELSELATPGKRVRSVGFSRDGRFLIISSSDKSSNSGTIIVKEMVSPASTAYTWQIDRDITFAALSSNGKRVAVAFATGEISLFDVATGPLIGSSPLPQPGRHNEEPFNAVAFSADGKRVAAGGDAEFAFIWNVDTLQMVKTGQHTGTIRALEFSPDGKILATASGDNTVIFWNPQTGEQTSSSLTGHHAPVLSLAFRPPDGKILASGSEDKSVILWDVALRKQMGFPLTKNLDSVRALAFSTDGKKLFAGSYEGHTCDWDLDPDSVAKRCMGRANRNLTKWESHVYFPKEPYKKTWPDFPASDEDEAMPAP